MDRSYIIDAIDLMESKGVELIDIIENVNDMVNDAAITEKKDIVAITNHLKLEVLDIDRFIKVNNWQEVTNPIFFNRPGEPNDDGLLSYRIFGATQKDRSSIFAYINLGKYFMNPVCYKAWFKLDRRIKDIIAKIDKYSLDRKGYLVKDPNGETGIEFLKKNISKIRFRDTGAASLRRDIKLDFLEKNRNLIFTNKFLVIPPFYRDTNNQNSKKGSVGVGKINKLYQQLILSAVGVKTTQEYGFDMSGPQDLRTQELLLQVYDWFSGTNNANIKKDEKGYGVTGKFGILRRANQSKTTDYAARLVISSPELKANSPKDMRANFDTSLVPLSAAIACFAPFVQFNVRRWFETEFVGTEQYPVVMENGKVEYRVVKDPMIQFSDDKIRSEMNHFIHGYNNRFVPIEVELEDGSKAYMNFKGTYNEGDNPEAIYNRRLTWLDVLYISALRATKNKMVLITRFPVDTRTNQITTGIDILTTNETEPMYVENEYYPYYPKFSDSDIGKDTSDTFIDTLNMSNLYLKGMGGDYDGDQVVIRGVFTDEANDELHKFHNSKKNFIGFGAKNMRVVDGDVVQSLYNLTKILNDDKKKITNPVF